MNQMYVTNDYNYEDDEEDPNDGMKQFTEDLDKKNTNTNKMEKKTQNLIKILIGVITTLILVIIVGTFIGYTFFVSKTTPTTPTTTLPPGKENC